MKTKIVYVLVSSEDDIYLEQAWASIFSLRHFNQDVNVVEVCDDRTAKRINDRSPEEFRRIAGEIVSVPFEECVSNRERSRWLKTNLRSLVNGDFLFLDTDTIITGSLAEVDSFEFDLGMVYDWHCRLKDRPNRMGIIKRVTNLFDVNIKAETDYFNSGVIYCKDSEFSVLFYNRWHNHWNESKNMPRGIQDQQSLMVTVNELGGVNAISGDYNCQPIVSMRFLATAKIVHFFNTKWDSHDLSPFYGKEIYLRIKNAGTITEEDKKQIMNCRSTFVAPSMSICEEDIQIWRSPAFKLLRKLFNHHHLIYKVVNKISKGFVKIKKNAF